LAGENFFKRNKKKKTQTKSTSEGEKREEEGLQGYAGSTAKMDANM